MLFHIAMKQVVSAYTVPFFMLLLDYSSCFMDICVYNPVCSLCLMSRQYSIVGRRIMNEDVN